jgi:hypothetical protein
MYDGIASNPTHVEVLRSFVALLTSAAEIGAVVKKSDKAGKESVFRICDKLIFKPDKRVILPFHI